MFHSRMSPHAGFACMFESAGAVATTLVPVVAGPGGLRVIACLPKCLVRGPLAISTARCGGVPTDQSHLL